MRGYIKAAGIALLALAATQEADAQRNSGVQRISRTPRIQNMPSVNYSAQGFNKDFSYSFSTGHPSLFQHAGYAWWRSGTYSCYFPWTKAFRNYYLAEHGNTQEASRQYDEMAGRETVDLNDRVAMHRRRQNLLNNAKGRGRQERVINLNNAIPEDRQYSGPAVKEETKRMKQTAIPETPAVPEQQSSSKPLVVIREQPMNEPVQAGKKVIIMLSGIRAAWQTCR